MAETGEKQDLEARIRALLAKAPVIDGHNDVPWQYCKRVEGRLDGIDLAADTSTLEPPMHTDLPRLARGSVGGVFWAVYVEVDRAGNGAAAVLFRRLDLTVRMIERHAGLVLARSADEVERAMAAGRIASLIGIEGGHAIESSLALLRCAHAAGARYMTLTHSRNVAWADACSEPPEHHGLTAFGREVVREMNRLGMLVDLSHVAPATMHDALDTSEAPVIFSHSGARAITDHPRNVPDDVLARVPDNDGLVMVTFVPAFVSESVRRHVAERAAASARLETLLPHDLEQRLERLAGWDAEHPAPRASLADVADHIDHVRTRVGVDHVGLGSDFDGIAETPDGLEDVSRFPDLLVELARRGWDDAALAKIASGNVLRVLRSAEKVAGRISELRGPSEATIEELDGLPGGGVGAAG